MKPTEIVFLTISATIIVLGIAGTIGQGIYTEGRQSVLEEIKIECTPVLTESVEGNDWYCKGEFTDY